MNRTLVSVIMSVYNSEKYLAEAIESILNQTYTNFEFIIINDGSIDSSLEIIQKYMKNDKRIVLITRENKGLPYSLNEGIQKANGDYIARMDADDISLPTRIEEQVGFLSDNLCVDVVGTWAKAFSPKYNSVMRFPVNHNEMKTRLLFAVCFAHPTVVFRKRVFTEFGIYYNNSAQTAQDYYLWCSLVNKVKFSNIPKVLLKYRLSENSISAITEKNKKELKRNILTDSRKLILSDWSFDEKEINLFYDLGLTSRIKQSKINMKDLNLFFNKILELNKLNKNFCHMYLKLYLGKKFLIFIYVQLIHKRDLNFINAIFTRYFYYGLFQIARERIIKDVWRWGKC